GTTLKEGAVGALARTKLASNAQIGIDFDAPVWVVILIRNPEHTGVHRAVFNTSGRTRAPGTVVKNHREDLRFLFPEVGPAVRHRLQFDKRSNHLRSFSHLVSQKVYNF